MIVLIGFAVTYGTALIVALVGVVLVIIDWLAIR